MKVFHKTAATHEHFFARSTLAVFFHCSRGQGKSAASHREVGHREARVAAYGGAALPSWRIRWVCIIGVLGASPSCQIEPFYFVLFRGIRWGIVIKFRFSLVLHRTSFLSSSDSCVFLFCVRLVFLCSFSYLFATLSRPSFGFLTTFVCSIFFLK